MTGNDLEKEMLLLERIKKDKSLFDELYNSLYNQVYRYCLALTNHIQDAEDIASRTFLELYQKIDVFVWEEKPIKLWLFKTARYLYLNKIRKIEPSESFDEEMAVLDHHEITFVDEIIQKDLIKIVKKEISRLPTAQREVIELKLLEELQFNEIAEIVGKNENTCKTIFYRGIKNLKQTLNKNFRYKDLSIPILLTSIVQSLGQGDLSLSKPVILENIINKPQNMNQILTSKALITVIVVSSTAIAAVIGVTVYNSQSSQKDNSKQEQKVEQIDQIANTTPITQTPSVTDTPISTPTSSPSPTPSNTVAPTQIVPANKSFSNSWLSLTYPSKYTLTSGTEKPATVQYNYVRINLGNGRTLTIKDQPSTVCKGICGSTSVVSCSLPSGTLSTGAKTYSIGEGTYYAFTQGCGSSVPFNIEHYIQLQTTRSLYINLQGPNASTDIANAFEIIQTIRTK